VIQAISRHDTPKHMQVIAHSTETDSCSSSLEKHNILCLMKRFLHSYRHSHMYMCECFDEPYRHLRFYIALMQLLSLCSSCMCTVYKHACTVHCYVQWYSHKLHTTVTRTACVCSRSTTTSPYCYRYYY
jgi:hypothetical protein